MTGDKMQPNVKRGPNKRSRGYVYVYYALVFPNSHPFMDID